MANNLLEGWSVSTLKNLISLDGIFTDGDWIESKDQDPNGSIRLIQLADIGDGKFLDRSSRFVNKEKFISLGCEEIFENDVLIARMPDPLGRACILQNLPQQSITVVDIAIIRPGKNSVLPKWLMHFINAPEIRQKIELLSTGTTRKRISRSNLEQISIPVPPINEQKRIADKLDRLMVQVDACREHLERSLALIKRFRQAVLAAAVSGRLTEEWRKKNEINNHWEQKTIGEVTENAKQYKPKSDEEFYYIDIASIDKDQKKIINPKEYLGKDAPSRARQVVETGDILVSMTRPNLNSVALVTPEFNNQIASTGFDVLRPINIEPEWLFLLVRTDKFIAKMSELVQGALYPAIRPKDIRSFSIPSPSLNEQKEIIRRVEALFAYADRLESRYQTARKLVDDLTPALLAKAFRGELVPQDPNDESASMLLERIRIEKAKQAEEPRRVGKKQPREVKMTGDSVKEIIQNLPQDTFSFDELREKISGDYDEIKDILFNLLAEPNPQIRQVFDTSTQAIRFIRSGR